VPVDHHTHDVPIDLIELFASTDERTVCSPMAVDDEQDAAGKRRQRHRIGHAQQRWRVDDHQIGSPGHLTEKSHHG
jgi:hypothetical protein